MANEHTNAIGSTTFVEYWPDASRVDFVKKGLPPPTTIFKPRGAIKEAMSPKSRTRLLKLTATMKPVCPLFLTLTYIVPVDWQRASRDLDTFLKRFLRKFPNMSGIWRKEVQESRYHDTGDVVIHYHLILWGVRFVSKEWIASNWAEVVDQYDEQGRGPFTRIEKVHSRKKVLSYVSKYCAKLSSKSVPWPGGRSWGKFNEACLPVAESVKIEVPPFALWALIKAAMHNLSETTGKTYQQTFSTFFRENPATVLKLVEIVRGNILDWLSRGGADWMEADERNELLKWAAPAALAAWV